MQKVFDSLEGMLKQAGLNVEFQYYFGSGDVYIFLNGEDVGMVEDDGLTPLDFVIEVLERLSEEVSSTDYD